MLMSVEAWLPYGIKAGFTNREQGSGQFPYESLNLGLHVGDDDRTVLENRSRLASAIGLMPEDFVYAMQVHNNHAVYVSEKDRGKGALIYQDSIASADSLVTDAAGTVISILAADCVPVLFADVKSRVVGAAHAGWRGATGGIITSTVRLMQSRKVSIENLHVAIGPAIRGCCYEVDEPVMEAVRGAYDRFSSVTRPNVSTSKLRSDRYMLDLPGMIADELLSLGIAADRIQDFQHCTACTPGYFSHRKEHGRTGRQGAFVFIEKEKKTGDG